MVATTRVSFWTLIWPESLQTGARSGLLTPMLGKPNLFHLTVAIITLVLLMRKWFGLFLKKKKHILRCWDCLFLLNWTVFFFTLTLRKLKVGYKKQAFLILTWLAWFLLVFSLLKYIKLVDIWSRHIYILSIYRLGMTYKIDSLVPDCESAKFCFWEVLKYFWFELNFAESPPELGAGWLIWYLLHLKFMGIISGLVLEAQLNDLCQCCYMCWQNVCRQNLFIQSPKRDYLFLNVCRVEYNMNLQVTTWPDFPNSSDFLISPDLLKIARLDMFFLKVSGKAYPVAFCSTYSKMSVWLATNSRKILFCSAV